LNKSEIIQLKTKIGIHKRTLIRMGAGEFIIELWFKGIKKELYAIEFAINKLEKKEKILTQKDIKELKEKIELHERSLYSMGLEVDLVYDAFRTLIRMGAEEVIIDIWLQDKTKELEEVVNAIKEIEGKENK